jgi:hypothetical protein
MSFGSIQTYKEAGLAKMEWAVSDPCDVCAKNDGQVIVIGQTFASGDAQPPAHPHCRCVLLPVIPGMEDDDPMGIDGGLAPMPENATTVESDAMASNKTQAKYTNVQEWNKEELLNLSKIQDPNMIETKIWDSGSNSYIDIVRRPNDPRLQALLKTQGFADTPTLISANEYETLNGVKVYRGVTGSENLSAAQMVEQFKNGDMFVGTGVVGNGVYSGTNYEYVINYAGNNPKNVIEMAFKQNATFIEADIARAEAQKLSEAFYDKAFGRQYSLNMSDYLDYIKSYGDISAEEAKALGTMFREPGAYAALHGYDAIVAANSSTGESVYVILNRGAMVVKK